jgi:hypothetical protein
MLNINLKEEISLLFFIFISQENKDFKSFKVNFVALPPFPDKVASLIVDLFSCNFKIFSSTEFFIL